MKLLKYIPLQLIFFQIIGILIASFIPFTLKVVLLLIVIVIGGLIGTYSQNRNKIVQSSYFTMTSFFAFVLIGIASVTFSDTLLKKNHYTSYLTPQSNTAVLIIEKVLKPNNFYTNYFAKVVSLNSKTVQGKILLNIRKDSLAQKLTVDDKIIVIHAFDSIYKPQNPYQFSYKKYLEKQQVYHQISMGATEYFLLKNENSSLKGWAFYIRKQINVALKNNGFKGDELAIINALLLGQRQEISKDILQNYQNAGAIHILAVSGLHVGIVLLMLTFLLKPLEKLKHGVFIKLVLIIFLLWLFAIIAGLSASIIRSVIMFTAVGIAMTLKQSKNIYKALIISIFFLLLFHPNYLFNVGFQLSYLAVFFIVWTQPLLYRLWKPSLQIIDYFWQLLTVSIAAQLGVLPLSLFYFHQFPGLFFVANLIIIPFLGIILGGGILIIVLALLNILPATIADFYEKIISQLNSIIKWISNQESFLFQNISFTLISVFLYFLFIITFFKWIEIKKPTYLKIALIAIIGFQLHIISEKHFSSTNSEFVIFNKTRHTILGIREARELHVHHTLDTLTIKNENSIKRYLTGSRTILSTFKKQPRNVYNLNNKRILVIDSLGVYQVPNLLSKYILLRQSPNINLERLIKILKPELIIADASNYKSHISRWKKTCKNYNITFHYTVKDGAFIEEL